MRRAAAVLLTVAALAWLRHVGAAPAVPVSVTTLAVGVTLICAWLAGDLLRRLRLPRVTGYLLFGLLLGPYLGNVVTTDMAAQLQVVTRAASALIALMAGLMLNVTRLRHRAGELGRVTTLTVIASVGGLTVIAWLCWPWLPIAPDAQGASRVAMALMVGLIAASFSPTMTAAVATETQARGPVTELVLAVTVLADLILLLGFSVALPFAREATGTGGLVTTPLMLRLAWEVGGAAAFGVLTGAIFALYLRYVGREVTLALLGICLLLSHIGTFEELQPLLAAVAAGAIIENLAPAQGEQLRLALRRGATPVLLIFFVSIGISLHPDLLLQVGVAGVALMALRMVLLRGAVSLALRRAPAAAGRVAWTGLISQAGITLGFAATLAAEFGDWGRRIQLLLVAMLAINEIIGPLLFRRGLAQAGEITDGDPPALIVASNREPYLHRHTPSGIAVSSTTGGVAVALDALLRRRGGVWVAHGSGDADREVVDGADRIAVPPADPAYALRRIWIDELTFSAYYGGFANEGLWPLCHQVDVRPGFRTEEWAAYGEVNRQFAAAIDEEMGDADAAPVFIQDYHLALVAAALRQRRPLARTALFWHIPWPHPDRLRICPWYRELLDGLLANDLLAFQLEQDRHNFLEAIERWLGAAAIDGPYVRHGGRRTSVVSVPIGIDFDRIQLLTTAEQVSAERDRLTSLFGLTGQLVGVGVDRLDYTKGIPERLAALDRLLTRRPELVHRLTFVQVGVPSRSELRDYAAVENEVTRAVSTLNRKYRDRREGPLVRYHRTPLNLTSLVALYQLSHFCVVSSLHDGMNLVAKEFIASRQDEAGVLVLSALAGAAEELTDALLINPYDLDGFAAALARAVDMPLEEQVQRMRALRQTVAGRDVFLWASDILNGLDDLSGAPWGTLHTWRDIAV